MPRDGRVSPYVPLGVAVACVSSGSLFVRLAAAPALAVAFERVFLASLLLAPFALKPLLRAWNGLVPRHRLMVLVCGVSLALHFATWIASLSYTTVASSVLLVNTAPLFSIALSRLALHEPVPRVVVSATAIALAGAGLIALGDWQAGSHSLRGDALAVVGALTLAIYQVIGRGLRAALPLNAYVLAVWSSAAVALWIFAAAAGVPLTGYPDKTWLAFLALAIVPMIGGHGLMNLSLRSLPAPTVGLFLLGEPIGAALLAFVFLSETPGAHTLAGGAIVLSALALVVMRGRS